MCDWGVTHEELLELLGEDRSGLIPLGKLSRKVPDLWDRIGEPSKFLQQPSQPPCVHREDSSERGGSSGIGLVEDGLWGGLDEMFVPAPYPPPILGTRVRGPVGPLSARQCA